MKQDLPEIALPAWNAYREMEKSKGQYFGYLSELECKYEHGGSRSRSENDRLEALLKQHDDHVQGFRRAMNRLKARDANAHRALIEQIKLLNADIGRTDEVKRN
jgi:hypothetical protein